MKEKTYSETIANAIKSYLKEDDWHFSFDEEAGLFRFGLLLSCKLKKINYIVDVYEDEYIVYAIAPNGSGIVDIIFGNATAKEAVEKCEKATEDEMRSLLSELMEGEGGSEFSEMLAKLAERLGMPEEGDDESLDTSCVPATIKTDLFGTEGDDE